MPSILIIGENSFVGNSFIRLSENKNIRVSSSFVRASDINFSGIEVVFHVAAIVHVSGKVSPENYFRVNRDYSLEVAKYAKAAGVRQFVFMSTVKVYGEFEDGMKPWNELSDCRPTDYYGKSKHEAEVELQKLNDENFRVSIIRTPLVYGPGMKANMLKLKNLVKYSPVLPLAGIKNERNYTYIENLIGYIDRIIKSGSAGIFIAMDDEPVSTTRLIQFFADAMNRKIILVRLPDFLLKIIKNLFPENYKRLYGSIRLDNSHTRKVLGFKPSISTCDGIVRTICSEF